MHKVRSFTLKERRLIEHLLAAGTSNRDIAAQLSVDPSAISREISAATPVIPRKMLYRAELAHSIALLRSRNALTSPGFTANSAVSDFYQLDSDVPGGDA